jgi:hypothetical protein
MIAIIERLADDFRGFAPELVASPNALISRIIATSDCSENKAPYKTHVAASFPSLSGTFEGRTAAANMTVRNVFVIGPDQKIKLIIVYPMTTGRNFDEVLRVIGSLQLTAKHKVATPVNWKSGDDVIIAGSVSDDDAKKVYPNSWKAPRPYIRIVPQPRS